MNLRNYPFYILFGLLVSLSSAENLVGTRQEQAAKVETSFDVVYAQKVGLDGLIQNLSLDVFQSQHVLTDSKRPLIIIIHGGGFINGNKEQHHKWAVEYARIGYTVACINYRLTPKEIRNETAENFVTAATHAIEDGMDAIRFLKKESDRFGIDRTRIATIGMSAGGWISTINAIEYDTFNNTKSSYPHQSSKVKVAIASGVSLANDQTCKSIRDKLLSFDETDSPVLLFHAENIDNVTTAPWSEALELKARITNSGNDCELYPQPGNKHTDDMSPSGPHWKKIKTFLGKHL